MSAALQTSDLPAGFSIRPLQPTIGAEITGVDLSRPLSDAQRDAIRQAVLRHKVVFFRDQPLTSTQQEEFARQFGPLYRHPTAVKAPDQDNRLVPHLITAEPERGGKGKLHRVGNDVRDGYHTDTSWRLVPAWGAVLRPVDLPPLGGDTVWVDAALAYEELPEEIKARLEGLHVVHDFRASLLKKGHDYPLVSHPVVRTHHETGERVLWVNFTQKPSLIGLDPAEGAELLTIILDQYRRPEYQVRFSWKPGSLAFWDNRGAVHYAVRNYGDYPRVMERVLIADEALYAEL